MKKYIQPKAKLVRLSFETVLTTTSSMSVYDLPQNGTNALGKRNSQYIDEEEYWED